MQVLVFSQQSLHQIPTPSRCATARRTGEIEDGIMKRGYTGGFSGSIFTDTGGAVIVNLYTNPQEDVSIGVRHIPMAVPLGETGGWYLKELFSYPPQFKVEFEQSAGL